MTTSDLSICFPIGNLLRRYVSYIANDWMEESVMQEEKHDNFRALFSEINPLFLSSAELPNTVRLRIRMQGFVDPEILRHAVDRTMQRYPYFCVRLVKRQGQWGVKSGRLQGIRWSG